MKRTAKTWALLLAGALAVAAGGAAPAGADAKAADKAFRKGKKLLAQKKYEEACAAFEESFREDPAIGAQLNVARCFEEWGKLATAYAAYQEAQQLARATKDERAPQIKELLTKLDKQVPTVVITLPKGRLAPAGLALTLDGADLSTEQLGEAVRLDPGAHVLVTRAAEGEPQTTKIDAVVGKRLPIELPIDALTAPPAEKPASEDKPVLDVTRHQGGEARAAGRGRRIAALSIGGAGVVGLGLATYLAIDARGDYNDAFDSGCDAMTKQCSPAAFKATGDARSQANIATLVGGFALGAVAAGVVLYVTAPSGARGERATAGEAEAKARTLRPMLWRDGAGVAFGGAL